MRPSIFIANLLLLVSYLDSKKKMETTQRTQIENYIQSYNAFDTEGMLSDLDENIIFENYSADELTHSITGLEAFKQQATEAKSYFSSREQVITSWDFDGNQVNINLEYHAVLAIDFPNGMKAGDTLDLKGQSISHLEKAKSLRLKTGVKSLITQTFFNFVSSKHIGL